MRKQEDARYGKLTRWLIACPLTFVFVVAMTSAVLQTQVATAADWSTSELHVQYGELDDPFGGLGNAGGEADTLIFTWQHASGWKYGDNFFFIDWLHGEDDATDAYGEWYSNFSIEKMTGNDIEMGPVQDLGIIAGVNWGADPDVLIFLPGARAALNLPGFAFANLDVTAYLVDNPGAEEDSPRAPEQDDSFMVDFNFATKQTEIAALKWNLEGHIEYIAQGDNEFDSNEDYWILGQPQLRADIGEVIGLPENTLFAGIEYQFWINKLGGDEDENAVQGLVVWRL